VVLHRVRIPIGYEEVSPFLQEFNIEHLNALILNYEKKGGTSME
jgi:hypothetical protein